MFRPTLILAVLLGASAAHGQLKFDLDHLAARAQESVDISLDANTLGLAGAFLSRQDPAESKVRDLTKMIHGIYVRSFEFEKEGQYSPSDVESIRSQLKAPEWTRVIGVTGKGGNPDAEIYVRKVDGKNAGITILAAEPKEFTVVQILGPIDLEQLGDLGGKLGIPEMRVAPKPKPAPKPAKE